MRRRGLTQPATPAKVEGVSQWVFTGGPTESSVQKAVLQFRQKKARWPQIEGFLRKDGTSLHQVCSQLKDSPKKALLVTLATELGSKFVESILEHVRAIEVARLRLSKLASS